MTKFQDVCSVLGDHPEVNAFLAQHSPCEAS